MTETRDYLRVLAGEHGWSVQTSYSVDFFKKSDRNYVRISYTARGAINEVDFWDQHFKSGCRGKEEKVRRRLMR